MQCLFILYFWHFWFLTWLTDFHLTFIFVCIIPNHFIHLLHGLLKCTVSGNKPHQSTRLVGFCRHFKSPDYHMRQLILLLCTFASHSLQMTKIMIYHHSLILTDWYLGRYFCDQDNSFTIVLCNLRQNNRIIVLSVWAMRETSTQSTKPKNVVFTSGWFCPFIARRSVTKSDYNFICCRSQTSHNLYYVFTTSADRCSDVGWFANPVNRFGIYLSINYKCWNYL